MQRNVKRIERPATIVNLQELTSFVETALAEEKIPAKISARIGIAVDEIASNIVRYSDSDVLSVEVEARDDRVLIRFVDDGRPYDPTLAPQPDTGLSAEERQPGGLGIHLVRSLMDEVRYIYFEGHNILELKKRFADA